MSETAVSVGDGRPKIRLTWTQKMVTKRMHPYNYSMNRLLKSFGKLLGVINPCMIDTDLARLYLLSQGHEETFLSHTDINNCDLYNQTYNKNISDIRHWLFTNIAIKVDAYKRLFDLDKVFSSDDEDCYNYYLSNAPDSYGASKTEPIMLGYTSHLTPDILSELDELVDVIKNNKEFSLDDDLQRKRVLFKLQTINMMLKRNKMRNRAITDMYPTNAGECTHNRKLPGHLHAVRPVSDFSDPLCGILPYAETITKQYKNGVEYLDRCEQLYCKEKLSIYGMVFEILSRLRDTYDENSEPWQRSDGRTEGEISDRWILALPSYRPEFVITLDNKSNYKFKLRQDTDVSRDRCSMKYLRRVQVLI